MRRHNTKGRAGRGAAQANVIAGPECERCGKALPLCVCGGIEPIDNKVSLLILQHPQEQDRDLGTARLAALQCRDAVLKVGLSWPNLAKALGRPADPQRWAVLYLGSLHAEELAPEHEIVAVNRKGEAAAGQDAALRDVEGIILLDGSWSQAKALWWRNAWLLKCKRVVLGPRQPSRYGRLRREPRRDSLSTIEAAGLLLSRLEGCPEISQAFNKTFERLLTCYRDAMRATKRDATQRTHSGAADTDPNAQPSPIKTDG